MNLERFLPGLGLLLASYSRSLVSALRYRTAPPPGESSAPLERDSSSKRAAAPQEPVKARPGPALVGNGSLTSFSSLTADLKPLIDRTEVNNRVSRQAALGRRTCHAQPTLV